MVCSTGFGFILKSHIFMMKELILLKGKCTNSPRNAAKSTTSHITASQIFSRMCGEVEKKPMKFAASHRFFLVCGEN